MYWQLYSVTYKQQRINYNRFRRYFYFIETFFFLVNLSLKHKNANATRKKNYVSMWTLCIFVCITHTDADTHGKKNHTKKLHCTIHILAGFSFCSRSIRRMVQATIFNAVFFSLHRFQTI